MTGNRHKLLTRPSRGHCQRLISVRSLIRAGQPKRGCDPTLRNSSIQSEVRCLALPCSRRPTSFSFGTRAIITSSWMASRCGFSAAASPQVYTELSFGRSGGEEAFGSLGVLLEKDQAYRASDQFAQDREFWSDYLADHPGPVGLGNGRVSAKSDRFIRQTGYLDRSNVERLRAIAQDMDTKLPQVICAAIAIFLHRLTGERELVIGLPVAARDDAARNVPGMVSNVLPLRLSVYPGATVAEIIEQTSLQVRRVLTHRRYQIADLRRDAGQVGDGRLFGVSANIMRFDHDFSFAGHQAIAHNLSLGPVEDLSIAFYDHSLAGPMRIDFDANPTLHHASDLASRQREFLRLFASIEFIGPRDRFA